MNPEHKIYLGDGVYVDFDGWNMVLTTENGGLFRPNTIYLTPEVMSGLYRYAVQHGWDKGNSTAAGKPKGYMTDEELRALIVRLKEATDYDTAHAREAIEELLVLRETVWSQGPKP